MIGNRCMAMIDSKVDKSKYVECTNGVIPINSKSLQYAKMSANMKMNDHVLINHFRFWQYYCIVDVIMISLGIKILYTIYICIYVLVSTISTIMWRQPFSTNIIIINIYNKNFSFFQQVYEQFWLKTTQFFFIKLYTKSKQVLTSCIHEPIFVLYLTNLYQKIYIYSITKQTYHLRLSIDL